MTKQLSFIKTNDQVRFIKELPYSLCARYNDEFRQSITWLNLVSQNVVMSFEMITALVVNSIDCLKYKSENAAQDGKPDSYKDAELLFFEYGQQFSQLSPYDQLRMKMKVVELYFSKTIGISYVLGKVWTKIIHWNVNNVHLITYIETHGYTRGAMIFTVHNEPIYNIDVIYQYLLDGNKWGLDELYMTTYKLIVKAIGIIKQKYTVDNAREMLKNEKLIQKHSNVVRYIMTSQLHPDSDPYYNQKLVADMTTDTAQEIKERLTRMSVGNMDIEVFEEELMNTSHE